MSKSFTQGEIDKAYDAAPALVQDALVTDPYLDFVLSLQSVYQLHIDIAGSVTEQMRNLLLGLINPTEFVQSLQSFNIPAETVRQLTTDLNQKVFLPLQKHMREGADRAPLVQTVPVPAPAPVQPPAPPTPRTQPTYATVPAYTPPAPPPSVSQFAPQAQPQEFIRTMNTDMHAVQEHQAPEMRPFSAPPTAPAPLPITAPPAPISQPQPVFAPNQAPAQPITPTISTISPQPVAAPRPSLPSQTPRLQPASAADANRDALHAVLKEYGVDPYREPIE